MSVQKIPALSGSRKRVTGVVFGSDDKGGVIVKITRSHWLTQWHTLFHGPLIPSEERIESTRIYHPTVVNANKLLYALRMWKYT